MATTRDVMVGNRLPGSLVVKMSVVLGGGSSSSFRNAFAPWSPPNCVIIRSASPTTNTARCAMAGLRVD
jgi:hypothetical protein